MILLDSDIFIDILRGYAPTVAGFAALSELPQVPGQAVLELLADLSVVWPSPAACQTALDGYPDHRLRFNLGPVDALIAACALEHAATLYTFNVKHPRPGCTLPYVKSAPPQS